MKNNYARIGLTLFVICSFGQVFAQKKITGKVIDSETKEGLIGASIHAKGTNAGTFSERDGLFSLSVPDNATKLEISFIGYDSKELEIGNQTDFEVVLQVGNALEEVIVVGYGTQKKADITGAIAKFDAEKIDERPIQRVDQALVGQMAGVRVQQTSGLPGAAFSIQVRGTGSINANNQPLYVIDGFPLEVSEQNSSGGFSSGNPLDNINPNDISSIEVLKDAAASAIYGSRASNGVVLITTKSGKTGKAKINFNASIGVNETSRKLDILNGEEWAERASEMIDAAWVASGTDRTADQTSAERLAILGSFNRGLIKDDRWAVPGHPGLTYVDWQDEIFRKGVTQNYTISASGGIANVNYFVSGDVKDNDGIAIGVAYKQYSARANVEVKANDKLKFGVNIAPSYSIASNPGVEGKDNQMHIAVSMVPITEENVGLDVNVGENTIYTWGNSRPSPVRVVENSIGDTKRFRTLTTIFAEYEIIKNLKLRTSLNLDNTDQSSKSYVPAFVTGNRTAGGSFSGFNKKTFVNENTLSYTENINSIHNISALIGSSYNTSKFDNFAIGVSGGFNSDVITTLNAAKINAARTYTRETKNTLVSFFGRVQYSLLDKYLLTGSLRRDGSSRFGPATKWGIFPSASVGWRVSEENFLKGVKFISNLKLRASWGISGNNGIGDYTHVSLLNFGYYSFGGALASGQIPSNFANSSLGWESSETIDIGVDFGIFNNRITSSIDYYTKRNSDLLLNIPIPTAVGFSSALTNIGEVLNKGWELEVNTRNLIKAFRWNTSLNLSHNSNKVIKLGPEDTPILGGSFDITHNILMVGQPMYSLFLVQQTGILTKADIDNEVPLYGSQQEGDPRYLDANGDGLISPADRVLSGHPNPDFVWGITNTFNYKNFDLNFLVQGQWGGKIYSTFGRAVDRTGMGFVDNALGFYRDRWRSSEDPGAGKRGKATSTFGRIKNTDWLYPSDYWRIRNVTLGYNLPPNATPKFMSNFRIYATAENYFGKNKYLGGFNPEAVNNGGDDYGAFPLAKSLILGLNVSF